MASGMGMPSIGIYSYELYTQYDVENIIPIGSAGAYTADLKLFDVVLAEKAWSESSFAKTQNGQETDTTLPSEALNEKLIAASKRTGILLTPVIVHSSDVFYRESTAQSYQEVCREHGCACVEMESFALPQRQRAAQERSLPFDHLRLLRDRREGFAGGPPDSVYQYDERLRWRPRWRSKDV